MPFGMKVWAGAAWPWNTCATNALRSIACDMACRTLRLLGGGGLTRKTIQNTVRFGVLTSRRLSAESLLTDEACAGCTDISSSSPFLYFVSATAPSLTIMKSMRTNDGFGPQ